MPFTCTVTVTDSGGLTGTTELEMDIQDINNNDPVFSQNRTDYIIYAEPTLTSGKFVGQVIICSFLRSIENDNDD